MALDPMVNSWVERFYYKGVGLQLPARYPKSPNEYNVEFRRNMLQPVQKFMGKDYTPEKVPEFMKAYQELGKISAFHMLPVLRFDPKDTADWQTRLKNAYAELIKNADVYWCLTKGGQLFRAYVRNNKVIGEFPVRVVPIISARLLNKNDAPGFISDLLTKNPLTLTDIECEIMRRIFDADDTYDRNQVTAEVEVFSDGEFTVKRVSPLDAEFPPYALRQLFTLLPATNDYGSLHEQAWMYCKQNPQGNEELLHYLNGILNVTDENAKGYKNIADMLEQYVNDGNLQPYWTVQDIIEWYRDNKYPQTPDPSNMELSEENDQRFGYALKQTMEYLRESPEVHGWPLKDVQRLLETGEGDGTFNSVQELLDSGIDLSQECIQEIAGNARKQLVSNGIGEGLVDAIMHGGEPSIEEYVLANIFEKRGWSRELAINVYNSKEVDPEIAFLKWYLHEELEFTNDEVKQIVSNEIPEQPPTVSALKKFLNETCPQYSDEDIQAIMKGKAKGSIDEDAVFKWLQTEYPSYSSDFINQLLMGRVPSDNTFPIDNFWTLQASDVISDDLRKMLITPEMIMSCSQIPDSIRESILRAVVDHQPIDWDYQLNAKLREIGFDEDTANMIQAGELPMVDNVVVNEHPTVEIDPFEEVLRGMMDTRHQVLLRKLMVALNLYDENTAYKLSIGKLPDPKEEILKESNPTVREEVARELMASVMGIPAEEVHFEKDHDAPVEDNISLRIGFYLLKTMKEELAEVDKLAYKESMAIRKGFIPLFKGMVTVFAAKDDPKQLINTLNILKNSKGISERAANVVADAITYAEEQLAG